MLLSAAPGLRKVPAPERGFTIQNILAGSVEELGEAGQDHRYGFGRLDIFRAVGFAKAEGF